jgi:hypothetical protein
LTSSPVHRILLEKKIPVSERAREERKSCLGGLQPNKKGWPRFENF